MIEKLILLIIALLVLGFVFYLIDFALAQIPTIAPMRNVIRAVLALVLALVVLYLFFGDGRFGLARTTYHEAQGQTVQAQKHYVHVEGAMR